MSNHDDVATLVFKDMSEDLIFYPHAEIVTALDCIAAYDPHAVGFMERALTTGPEEARLAVAPKIAAILENITEAFALNLDPTPRFQRTLGEHLVDEVMTCWSVAYVSSECSNEFEDYRINIWMQKALWGLSEDKLGLRSHPVKFEDWRGMAALGAARIEDAPDQIVEKFIRYAGQAQDIATIIRTARDRRTLDPETIESLIAGSEATSLRSGAL